MKLGLQLHILLVTIRTFHSLSKENGMDEKEVFKVLDEIAELDTFDRKMKMFYSFKFMQHSIDNILEESGVVKMGW